MSEAPKADATASPAPTGADVSRRGFISWIGIAWVSRQERHTEAFIGLLYAVGIYPEKGGFCRTDALGDWYQTSPTL